MRSPNLFSCTLTTPFHPGTHHKLTFNANPQNGYVSLYVTSVRPVIQAIGMLARTHRRRRTSGKASDALEVVKWRLLYLTTGSGARPTNRGRITSLFWSGGQCHVITGTTSLQCFDASQWESMHEKVLRRHYEYFKIILPAGQDLHIGVTTYGGDPDLYLSCKYNATQNDDGYPSLRTGHYDWRGWSLGNDVITVKASESCAAKSQDSGQTTIYAAVHGFQDSVFAITALAGNDTVVQLEDGRPVEWIVEQHKYARFAVYTGGMGSTTRPSLNIELTPTNCDVDLYVKYCTDPDLNNCEDATKRRITSAAYKMKALRR